MEGDSSHECLEGSSSDVAGSWDTALDEGWHAGVRVQRLGGGFGVHGSGFRVQGSGFKVQGSGFRVQGSGSKVSLACPAGSRTSSDVAGSWDESLDKD